MAIRTNLTLALALPIAGSVPLHAQDTWNDYAVMTGQGAVLDNMNREATRQMHREKGLPPPDFKAAERRLAQRNAARRSNGRMTASERARKCAFVRANLAKLRPDQLATYRKACE